MGRERCYWWKKITVPPYVVDKFITNKNKQLQTTETGAKITHTSRWLWDGGVKSRIGYHFLLTSYSNSLPVYISCVACMLENEPHTHILAHNACLW